jgi:iron complex transport system ATP-binding protein
MEQPMLTFDVAVAAVERLSPTFTRVTFEGEALRDFHRCGELGSRDLRIKLLIAADSSGPAPVTPDFSGAGGYASWRALDEAVRGVARTYTVRRIHGTDQEPLVDLDFVLHAGGAASTWAESAEPGDRMFVIGPNRASEWYGGIEWQPPTVARTRVLLVGDETALPAIGSILETLPAAYVGDVVVEVPTERDFLTLATRAQLDISFVARDNDPRGERLLQEVRRAVQVRAPSSPVPLDDVDVDRELLWEVPERSESTFYAWVAGEAAIVRTIRRTLVDDHGVDRRAVAFMGYWREGKAEVS